MSSSPQSKPSVRGYVIVGLSIVLAAFIHSRAPRYTRLESGELLNQTDGTIYRSTQLFSSAPEYEARPGPSHLTYGVLPTATIKRHENSDSTRFD
ncbi:hypothetical protein OAH18_01710 [bacterium]|nr:hypothetical protein [bacterium]